jgi:beta-phosphoglucomutase-like phosphatase (HAD superfamily)
LKTIPAQAAVFEDAIAGVAAGRAGRFGRVVGVDRSSGATGGPRSHGEELREHGADIVVRDLAELLERA